MFDRQPLRRVQAGALDVALHEAGPAGGVPVFLLHGFPYDVHSYAEVGPMLAARGCRVFVPYLRGFGPTRFLGATTPRSGEQAALGADLLALMDALGIGRAALDADRRAVCRLLWRLWSPTWSFDEATFARTAQAFDNPDFVAVVIHSCRHRFGLVAGDPALPQVERRLAAQPPITVASITFDGADDGVRPAAGAQQHARHFTGPRSHRVVPGAGHNLPQEAPRAFADAVLELAAAHRGRVAQPDRS